MCNESALHAACYKQKRVCRDNLEYTIDRLVDATTRNATTPCHRRRNVSWRTICQDMRLSACLLQYSDSLLKVWRQKISQTLTLIFALFLSIVHFDLAADIDAGSKSIFPFDVFFLFYFLFIFPFLFRFSIWHRCDIEKSMSNGNPKMLTLFSRMCVLAWMFISRTERFTHWSVLLMFRFSGKAAFSTIWNTRFLLGMSASSD